MIAGRRTKNVLGVALGVDGREGYATVYDFEVWLVFEVECSQCAAWYGLREADDVVGPDDGALGKGSRERNASEDSQGEKSEESHHDSAATLCLSS